MIREYLKSKNQKIGAIKVLKINLFCHLLYICTFFVLPFFIRQHLIIGNFAASLIKVCVLFLFELSFIPISISTMQLLKNVPYSDILKKIITTAPATIIFAFTKTTLIISSLYFFRLAIKTHPALAFLSCFFFFSAMCFVFWFPSVVTYQTELCNKCNFFSSLLASIKLFASNPFFSSFVLLHSLLLYAISILFLYIYPGQARIWFDINTAYCIMTKKRKEKILEHNGHS